MKKLIPFLFILLLACEKEDHTLIGTWDMSFTFTDSDTYKGTLVLAKSGGKLSGAFTFDDNSGSLTLSGSSMVTGLNVIINWTLESYDCSYTGTANEDMNSMLGSFYANSSFMGSWEATKK